MISTVVLLGFGSGNLIPTLGFVSNASIVIPDGPSIPFIDRPYHVFVPGDARRSVFVAGDDRRFVKPGELPVP